MGWRGTAQRNHAAQNLLQTQSNAMARLVVLACGEYHATLETLGLSPIPISFKIF